MTVVAVAGCFRGGTSCVAGLLHGLGVPMGGPMKKANRHNPEGYFEDLNLQKIMLRAWADRMEMLVDPVSLMADLEGWLEGRKGRWVGAKHPSLCMCVPHAQKAWGDVRWVVVDREVSQVVASWRRTGWGPKNSQAIARIVRAHYEARDRGLLRCPPEAVLRVPFCMVRKEPVRVVEWLNRWLGLEASEERVATVAASVYQKKPGSK